MSSQTNSLAQHLTKRLQCSELAFLCHRGTVYVSKQGSDPGPYTPVTTLIQGLYEKEKENAFRFLRERIYSTMPLTEKCRAMVKVAAKRVTVLEIDAIGAPSTGTDSGGTKFLIFPIIEIEFTPSADFLETFDPSLGTDYLRLAQKYSQAVSCLPERYLSDRSVAAVLVSRDDQILAIAKNSNSRNKTLHAEVKLVQGFYEKFKTKLPPGAKIYTSLQPCKMCAALIFEMAEDPHSLHVYYGEADPGPMAQETLLERLQLQSLLETHVSQEATLRNDSQQTTIGNNQ